MPQEGNTRVMEQFDTLDVSAVLNLESALVRDGASRQVLPAAVPLIRDCKMKAKEKYQSDVWLEIEHLNKGIVREDPRSSSVAPCDTTTSAVAQCETDPVENILDQNLKIKFYISSGSASPSSHSGDEADPVKIVDSAHLPVHTPTIKRKEYHSSILFPTKNKSHQFFLTSFTAPTKCHQCTSLMVGLIRQGCACDACGFSCHTTCVEKAPRACPVPSQQKRGTLCVDVQEGMGTAYEGHVWIPKKAGVKKGWQRALAIVCDFKLFLYNMEEEKGSKPNVVVSQVIDMRDGAFSVSSVWPSDFIPVRRKEMSRMFKVTASQLSAPSNRYSVPILADSENDKCEWVGVLSDLHRMLRKSHSRDRSVYVLKEAYDSSLPLIKTTQTAAIIDHKRIALGNEEGLFVVHVTIDGYNAPYLSVYSENAVDIFDVNSMEWIQTVPLKKVRPLNSEGSLNILLSETIRLIYFTNKMTYGDELVFPETSDSHQKQMVRHLHSKRRYSFRVPRGKERLPIGL
ncbi:serine/threonine-protein kinase MRCK alpha-like isoform X10 [Canis lupus baileyi]|uniref:serine/threonine-protein kinase MRCK alpha-like isoform X10 n=1 Tax=Canis lupus dingo TaxID=286419 RepID=UPI0020C4E20A|nr:serine/threonine-protein kinase MRCK alpha-like isoform X10 [Canis lupus dingo]